MKAIQYLGMPLRVWKAQIPFGNLGMNCVVSWF